MWFIVMVAVVAAVILLAWRRRGPSPAGVQVTSRGVRRQAPDGRVEEVAWDKLVQVSIVTSDEGPYNEDLFFLLQGADGGGCAVASDEAEATGLVMRLQQLPGFDHDALIQASSCTIEAHFICWRGRPGEGLAAAREDLPA